MLVTSTIALRIYRPTISSAILSNISNSVVIPNCYFYYGARLESKNPCFRIFDRLDAHYLSVLVRCSLFGIIILLLPSFLNRIHFVNHNENFMLESCIAVHQTLLVFLYRSFVTSSPRPRRSRNSPNLLGGGEYYGVFGFMIDVRYYFTIETPHPSTHYTLVVPRVYIFLHYSVPDRI